MRVDTLSQVSVLAAVGLWLGCGPLHDGPQQQVERRDGEIDAQDSEAVDDVDQPAVVDPPNCGGALAKPAVELRWSDVVMATDLAPSVTTLGIVASNTTDRAAYLDNLRIIGDAAGGAVSTDFDGFLLAAGDEISWSIALSELPFDAAEMQVAGVLVVEADISDEGGVPIGRTASDPIYFHPTGEPEHFDAYGEMTMREQFAAGDFIAAQSDEVREQAEANPRLRRVMQGGIEIPGGAE
jgi:hypothetical protein